MEFNDPAQNYEPIDPAHCIRLEIVTDSDRYYTRENYFDILQSAFNTVSQIEVQNIRLGKGISINYDVYKAGNISLPMYKFEFNEGWGMLYDANEVELMHIDIARIFGYFHLAIFEIKSKSFHISKYDNLYGELAEHK